MLLAIDIGNTSINFGVFKGKRLVKKFCIPTIKYNSKRLKVCLAKARIDDAIICSVVPAVSKNLFRDLKKTLSKRPLVLGKDVTLPVKNLYRDPGQVGQDRLVNAFAASSIYGVPLIVVDLGTAVTLDVISKRGEYVGGMILPGLEISLDSLAERTALLPKIKLSKPKELVGRDTKSSINSGIVYGFAALVDDLTQRTKKEVGKQAKVIATGGNIDLIAKYCKNIHKIDKNLTLKGLSLVYERRKTI